MGHKVAIDFGTTNSVIAHWDEEKKHAEIVSLLDFCSATIEDRPPVIPSLVYVHDGKTGEVSLGEQIRLKNLDTQRDNRLFRNFKRGIVTSPSPEPRDIDGIAWGDHDAGRVFNRKVIQSLPYGFDEIDQLVLTAPVASFEGYLQWLNSVIDDFPTDKIRIVDESTAAALGYAVTNPGAPVLVFDFGGGTLDLSLVQLPESREKTGGILRRLVNNSGAKQNAAKVIAKAGRVIGGSDIDQWLLQEVLKRAGVNNVELGKSYKTLLTRCEEAKIHLSNVTLTTVEFEGNSKTYQVTITREELENLLEENGFYTALRRVVDKVMYVARQRGIYKEDIGDVLMVGGTSLMPSVQRTLGQYFTLMAVRADKPFTAVAEGALQIAAGFGLDDYLVHSYGLRFLNSDGKHEL
jgi:molecular chaperone DnaK (HSP70)